MVKVLQVSGPVAPGQFQPLQVSGPSSYYPMQTTDWTSMLTAIMPMIMMMMGMMMPMMRGLMSSAKD